jgi:hypothetical protein
MFKFICTYFCSEGGDHLEDLGIDGNTRERVWARVDWSHLLQVIDQ